MEQKDIPICHVYNIIQDECSIILREYSDSLPYSVWKGIHNVLEWACVAEDQGQRMEDRLREYRSAIEGLGFKREKEV